MTTKKLLIAGLVAAAVSAMSGLAQAETWTKAEVKAVDTEESKITLKHEPLAEFDMPAMTMVFRMVDPAKLEGLAEGDQIEFVAGNENGQMVVKDLKKE